MYLQITTKCNMSCEHCCYSCTKWGRHGDYDTIYEAIRFAADWNETITIGGGEPTLHPKFFDILQDCLDKFDYVWFATNGSQTNTMFRLDYLLVNGHDDPEYYCDCDINDYLDDYEDKYEAYDAMYESCYCSGITLRNEDQLSVALSQDHFHDAIDYRVVELWKKRKREIRNVTNSNAGVIREGRGKLVGYTDNNDGENCVCSDIFITPTGKVKMCGCLTSPVIGNVRRGISLEYEEIIQNDEGYNNTNCYKGANKKDMRRAKEAFKSYGY